MRTMDSVFKKEFKRMLRERKRATDIQLSYRPLNLKEIPLPKIEFFIKNPKNEYANIKGIEEPFYDKLNGTNGILLDMKVLKKRTVLSDGSFWVKEGKYVYEDIEVKNGFKAIKSSTNIALRKKHIRDGRKVTYRPTEGFKYVDYIKVEGKKQYIYTIPKQNLYPYNYAALIVSTTMHKRYKGFKIALQNGHKVNLLVVPYNNVKNNSSVAIIGVKPSINFDKEIKKVVDFWTNQGIMFPTQLTATLEENLGYKRLRVTARPEEFNKTDGSMAE